MIKIDQETCILSKGSLLDALIMEQTIADNHCQYGVIDSRGNCIVLEYIILCEISIPATDSDYRVDGHKTPINVFAVTLFGADTRSTLVDFHFSFTT